VKKYGAMKLLGAVAQLHTAGPSLPEAENRGFGARNGMLRPEKPVHGTENRCFAAQVSVPTPAFFVRQHGFLVPFTPIGGRLFDMMDIARLPGYGPNRLLLLGPAIA
jgi:hypothetical protein